MISLIYYISHISTEDHAYSTLYFKPTEPRKGQISNVWVPRKCSLESDGLIRLYNNNIIIGS